MHREWTGDRPSPIWLVRETALSARPTARLEALSVPKKYHPDYHPKKSVYTTVSHYAKTAVPSKRIEDLARAKEYAELPIKPDSCWDYSEWQSDVSKAGNDYDHLFVTSSHNLYKLAKLIVWLKIWQIQFSYFRIWEGRRT